jgi:cellulose synthase operon protein C
MRTAAPVASVLLIGALVSAIVWQAVNLWRPHNFVMPTTPAHEFAPPPGGSVAQSPLGLRGSAPTDQSPVNAPSPSASSPETAPSSSSAKPSAPAVDETALRYFARQNDTRRLNAEIARLHALYPDWTPPADPLQAPPVADPQLDRLWRLYAQGHFAETRAAIAERQSSDPKWVPPKELTDRLDLADARERLVNASNAKQYATVIQIAASSPNLRTCGDVDVLWRVAEAFSATDREGRAVDAYRYILTECTNASERLATMQKAAAALPRSDVDALLALGHTSPEGNEFQTIREDVARRAVAAAGSDSKAQVREDDVAILEKTAEQGRSPSDPLLLGWYWLRHGDVAKAEHWFQTSYERENAAESAEGLSLALIELKKPAEAEAALARWRDANETAGKTYLSTVAGLLSVQPPPVVAPEVLARMVDAVAKHRDAATAQLLGWYSHAFRQDETAARWFATALAWKPDDEPSAYGLAIADLSLNRRPALQALLRTWSSRSLRIAALGDPAAARTLAMSHPAIQAPTVTSEAPLPAAAAPTPQATAETEAPNAPAAQNVERSASREPRGAEPSGLSEAWRLLQLDRGAEAAAAFREALTRGPAAERQDAAYGLSLAYLRLGLPIEADNAATLAPQSRAHNQQLRLSILTERIRQEYDAGRYRETIIDLDARTAMAPDTVDLMTVRGWSYYHLDRYDEARRVFEALAAAGNDDAQSALGVTEAALKRRKN